MSNLKHGDMVSIWRVKAIGRSIHRDERECHVVVLEGSGDIVFTVGWPDTLHNDEDFGIESVRHGSVAHVRYGFTEYAAVLAMLPLLEARM